MNTKTEMNPVLYFTFGAEHDDENHRDVQWHIVAGPDEAQLMEKIFLYLNKEVAT